MLEIGPGLGVLTRYLADRVARVHAVEIDRSLEPQLASGSPARRTSTAFGDALALDLADARPAAAQARREPALQRRDADRRREPRRPARGRALVRDGAARGRRPLLRRSPATKAYGAVSVLVQLAAERTGFHPVSRDGVPSAAERRLRARRVPPRRAPPDVAAREARRRGVVRAPAQDARELARARRRRRRERAAAALEPLGRDPRRARRGADAAGVRRARSRRSR